MTFPYYSYPLPAELQSTFASRALEMARKEVRERAGILMRLGHAQADVTQRLKQYVAWEYDLNGKAPVHAEVDDLVGGVYGRATTAAQKKAK